MMSRANIRVLLIEDDREDYLIMRDLIADIHGGGYTLDWVADFEVARETLRRREHEVGLVDYRLGARTGLELIRAVTQEGVDRPMILLTAQSRLDVDFESIQAGAADVLVKSQLNPVLLERSIRYALERKKSNEQIERLAAFARFNPNPVMEFAADGALLYCNGAARELAATLGGVAPSALLPRETPAIIRECLAGRQSKLNLQTTAGKRTLSWSFFPIPGTEVVHGYASDMTDRMALEGQLRQLHTMEAVGQLAAGVAHDFNNILTIIQGHAMLMADRLASDSENVRPLHEIQNAAERAGGLIRQLLMFSRKQILQPRALDLNTVLRAATVMLYRTLGEQVRIEVQAGEALPNIQADPAQIEQMLMNLALNARDAMPQGGLLTLASDMVHVTEVEARNNVEARPGSFVRLTMSDTGCGMSPETLCRAFEPFFTTKEVGKGTGLGLASVYGTVKQHKGWIQVKSQLGRGTTFEIYLPASVQTVVPPAQAAPLRPSRGRGQETILVVEDESSLRELVVEILKWNGYQVHSASCGAEALEQWPAIRERVALLVTDMVMPGMLGRELAERLQRDKPSLRVIYTSGYSPGMASSDLPLLEGFNFLPKPYPPSKLAQFVRECLEAPPRVVSAVPSLGTNP